MKKKMKITGGIIIFLLFAACIFAWILYTRPRRIQDEMVIVNIENGERHQVKLDIYQKKSLVRPTMHGGMVWVDGEEYVYEDEYEITWLNLKRKFEEMTSSENYYIGNFYNKKVKWPSQEYKSPFDDMVWIANYKTEGFRIRLTLFGEKCIFSAGTYLDEKSAELWLNMEEKETESK